MQPTNAGGGHPYQPVGAADPHGPGGGGGPPYGQQTGAYGQQTGAYGQQTGAYGQQPMSGGPIQKLQFAAAVCVVVGGLFGSVYCLLGDFQPLDMIQLLYLSLFGLVMMILDMPFGQMDPRIQTARRVVHKYFAIVTRVTGKGATLLFLGTMTFCALWVNEASYVLNTIISFVIMGTGVFTLYQGIKLTFKLHRTRNKFVTDGGEIQMAKKNFFDRCTATDPQARKNGMTKESFMTGCSQMSGEAFNQMDVNNIFNALSSSETLQTLFEEDVQEWFEQKYVLM